MNANNLATLMLANTSVVIDVNGEIRALLPGEVPAPGEVVVTVGQDTTAEAGVGVEAQLFGEESQGIGLDLDNEIAAIFEQIEQGADPTQNEDFATAAGGQGGSSLTATGAIERTGAETLAGTQFETSGLESQGLSETQSLALLDLVAQAVFVGQDSVSVFETDEPWVLNGSIEATDTDLPTFVVQENVVGENGVFSIDADGNWTYVANSAFDELNVGDSVSDVFSIQSADGTVGSVTVTINGTNDLPQFVAADSFGSENPDVVVPSYFENGAYTFDLPENTQAGTPIGQVAAVDPDNQVLIFSISNNIQNEQGDDLFQIDPDTGEISLTEAGAASYVNDFELLSNAHQLVVTVTEGDGIGEPQSVDVDVFFNEVNLDDNAPIFTGTGDNGEYSFTYNENSAESYVIGTVSAADADGEAVTYSIKTNVLNEANEPLFEIDAQSGEISLTAAGYEAFTNDYEALGNMHDIVVTATEVDGLGEVKTTDVNVNLDEVNLDDNAPEFNPNDGEQYAFSYFENNNVEHVIGTVSAVDSDGEDVTYSIKTNVFYNNEPLFAIDSTSGNISLTAAGVLAFTNNFEALANTHMLVVTATEVDGFGEQKSTDISVELSELNVNELPVTEDFDVDAGNAIYVPLVFDSSEPALDHISDEDDDFNNVDLNIMLTSLPQYGTLLYTDDFGDTRVITQADLHTLGDAIDPAKLFNPNNFSYVPGQGDPFEMGFSGDPSEMVPGSDGFYNWGVALSDTERLITLENGNTITISLDDNNDKPFHQYTGKQPHVGWGIGDSDGNGLNKQETLIVDLSDNPLDVVSFGLDGMGASFNTNSNVYVEVTYTLADGTQHVEQYQKDQGDVGNDQILYEFSYSSPDNPIVNMEMSSTGGNWELRYLSGTQDITEDVTFDYVAVDSDLAVSNESTVTIDVSESPEYQVLSADQGDNLDADLGNQVMLGDENANVFTWLDSTLDNGTDVVDNFTLGSDFIDLTGILEQDDNVVLGDLMDSISTQVSGDDVIMNVSDEGRTQTIILEGVTSAFEDAGLIDNSNITNELEMLTQILKTDTV
ncbi:cadherin repeat domain-containing protein [Vibrio sp. JPW-9-11-11]|uniref:cadherin domain-containing protein n=1 Tax=Vibrio sp. JPW-9-11-11 TaxID=1416532 RepID=UPI001593155A|nr:cadherin domain-containing protein [Vibrio sp. JPW-9-11-11]NVD06765.1 cadherin repeat domain-containing protein [Vibrio sp. JPW-9-11-11]